MSLFSLTERLKEVAVSLGFDLVGIAAARPARHAAAFRAWLAEGHHADMDWIAKDIERRIDPRIWRPEMRFMVVVGISYATQPPSPRLWNDPMRGRIARYAWGRDYHKVIPARLNKLADFIRSEAPPGTQCQSFTDARPVMEHDAALAAGLGFIGRNTLLIHPEWGSMLFLGGLLVSCELDADEPTPGEGAQYKGKADCGACRRCLNACPTHAFPAEYILNSRRCISYQTIENRGAIPLELRPKMGNWIFGCDACQEVCPWVKRYSHTGQKPWLEADPDRMAPRLEELAVLDDAGFLDRFAGTPVMRCKRRGLLRNVAVALGNSGCEEARALLLHLARDDEATVSEHAHWGLARLAETLS
jgi:epoxyqueuosine reductase